MNKRERIASAIAGLPVDRVPVSAWGHYYVDEVEPVQFAERMIAFQEEYDWDFLKVHARASYHVEPFGYTYYPSGAVHKGHTLKHTPVRDPEDWLNLRPMQVDTASFEEQLAALTIMRKRLPADLPIIMTVFTPLDIADKMLDRNASLLAEHIRIAPEAVGHALSVFSETLKPFVTKLVNFGVDGIFFSTKWSNGAKLSPKDYRKLCLPHDLHMMAPATSLPFNILHACENEVFLETFADYPVSTIHWDDNGRNNPSLRAGRIIAGRSVGGGVDSATLAQGTPMDVETKAINAILNSGGTGLLLGPGCSLNIAGTSSENLRALRNSPEKAARMLDR